MPKAKHNHPESRNDDATTRRDAVRQPRRHGSAPKAARRRWRPASPQGFVAFDCWSGAFSPDGSSLAVAVRAGGYEAERSLALVDLADRVARTVEGSTVDPVYVFVAWSSGGDRVFVSGGSDKRQLLQYRFGEPRALPLPVEVPDFYGMAAR